MGHDISPLPRITPSLAHIHSPTPDVPSFPDTPKVLPTNDMYTSITPAKVDLSPLYQHAQSILAQLHNAPNPVFSSPGEAESLRSNTRSDHEPNEKTDTRVLTVSTAPKYEDDRPQSELQDGDLDAPIESVVLELRLVSDPATDTFAHIDPQLLAPVQSSLSNTQPTNKSLAPNPSPPTIPPPSAPSEKHPARPSPSPTHNDTPPPSPTTPKR
ncbi:hypothetical protein AOQ84DRAFT_223224, partial [Glonium stellatum]